MSVYEIKLKSIGVYYVTFDMEIFCICIVFTAVLIFGIAFGFAIS